MTSAVPNDFFPVKIRWNEGTSVPNVLDWPRKAQKTGGWLGSPGLRDSSRSIKSDGDVSEPAVISSRFIGQASNCNSSAARAEVRSKGWDFCLAKLGPPSSGPLDGS